MIQSVNGKSGVAITLSASEVGALPSGGTAVAAKTAATATKLATARKIGGASFNGTADITLAQIGALAADGTAVAARTAAACSGTAATATKLATARKIGGASFDGAANITLAQIGAYPAANIRAGFAAGMANGTRSYKLFSKDQINQIFGTSGVDYGPQNMAIFVMNGDFSSGGLVAAITSVWSGGEIYVVNCDLNSTIPAGAHDVVFLAVKFS